MEKDYIQEAYEDIKFKYDDPYWRLLKRTKWLCRRLSEHQNILDISFVEELEAEERRLEFMMLYYEWYQRNENRFGDYHQHEISYEDYVEEECDRWVNLRLSYDWYQRKNNMKN